MELVEKIDDMGKPAWIGLMIIGFIIFWPIGLAILAYLFWSGRMGCWRGRKSEWRDRAMERAREAKKYWQAGRYPSSGNTAFDEYREETLKRLEEEQKEFHDFLRRLRQAKDKAEFDEFMAERGSRKSDEPPAPPAESSSGPSPSGGYSPSTP